MKTTSVCLCLVALLMASSSEGQAQTMLSALSALPGFSDTVLFSLVGAADFTSALNQTNITVFAPTDQAFTLIITALGGAPVRTCLTNTTKGKAALGQLLSYHAAVGSYPLPADNVTISTVFPNGKLLLNGTNTSATVAYGSTLNTTAMVTRANLVNSAAGVAHEVSSVLLPPNATQIVMAACSQGTPTTTTPPAAPSTTPMTPTPAASTKPPSPPPSGASTVVPSVLTSLATLASVFLLFRH